MKPTYEMDTSENVAAVLNSAEIPVTYRGEEGEDAEFCWPFIQTEKNGEVCFKASNQEIDDSFAILYMDVELKAGEAIGFDYIISSEQSADVLHIIVNDEPVYALSGVGAEETWKSCYPWVAVEDGTYEGFTSYCYQYIYPYTYVGKDTAILMTEEGREYLGTTEKVVPEHQILDVVTGEYFTAYETAVRDNNTAQGHWFLTNSAASQQYVTTINLPAVYLSEEDALYTTELFSVLENHIISESAKFITGTRPLSEIPAFQEELKAMGIEIDELTPEQYAYLHQC